MKVLVTGGAGYLGSVLIPKLVARGHQVRVIDIGYFGVSRLRATRPAVEILREDLRDIVESPVRLQEVLEGCQAVVHLAAISNDPSAELRPELTRELNFRTTVRLAEACRSLGIRFLFSSSCSIYGSSPGEATETSPVNPITVYAESKFNAEEALTAMADRCWRPVILRNGTLFGYSQRMRFDLVVNIFSLHSTLHNEITIFGTGEQWRPFLHVSDCAAAFVHFIEATESWHMCYNIAGQNLRVVDLAKIFQSMNPSLRVEHSLLPDPDRRDYAVSTDRMHESGFWARFDIRTGAEMLVESIISGLIPDPESNFYRNAKWLKELTSVGDDDHRRVTGLMETLANIGAEGRG